MFNLRASANFLAPGPLEDKPRRSDKAIELLVVDSMNEETGVELLMNLVAQQLVFFHTPNSFDWSPNDTDAETNCIKEVRLTKCYAKN